MSQRAVLIDEKNTPKAGKAGLFRLKKADFSNVKDEITSTVYIDILIFQVNIKLYIFEEICKSNDITQYLNNWNWLITRNAYDRHH